MKHFNRIAASILAFGLLPSTALAVIEGGALKGTVVDKDSRAPLAGVTVTITGPQGEQTEFTDAKGRYLITEVPEGEYVVRFYFSDVVVERPGVVVYGSKTLVVNSEISTAKAEKQTYTITEKAPSVDVAHTHVQIQVTDEITRSVPVQGRTQQGVLDLAPTAGTDLKGINFVGSSSAENNFMIDGLNTTGPSFGLLGTQLHLQFIEETQVITGGFSAEYGRSTGGVINVITKSGTNEHHGSVWTLVQPFQASAKSIGRVGEAISTRRKARSFATDFGFEIGGPIVKDHVFYYVGFAPSLVKQEVSRMIRTRTADQLQGDVLANAQTAGSYAGDQNTSLTCPSWLKDQNPLLCAGAEAGGFVTSDSGSEKTLTSKSWLLNWIAKVDFRYNNDHATTVQYVGSPSLFSGIFDNPINPTNPGDGAAVGFSRNPDSMGFDENIQVHDGLVRHTSKFFDRKLQVDVQAGFHIEDDDVDPHNPNVPQVIYETPQNLGNFESIGAACEPRVINGVSFNPCPIQNYQDGGFGFAFDRTAARYTTGLGLTYFLDLLGEHAIKVGGDIEFRSFRDRQFYTGGAENGILRVRTDGSVARKQFAQRNDDDTVTTLPAFENTTKSLSESLYLRDSFSLEHVPGLTLNLGVRWDLQQLKDLDGNTQASINDAISPRIGAVYDFTQKGLGKVYANYARYYESLPLRLNNRLFSRELLRGTGVPASACREDPPGSGRIDPNSCDFSGESEEFAAGGKIAVVTPDLEGQYSNEVVAGVEYDVGWDTVLGAAYIRRTLGSVVEDFSPDGNGFVLGNPGKEVDEATVNRLNDEIATLRNEVAAAAGDAQRQAELQEQLDRKELSLVGYQGQARHDKPKRDYNAMVLTAQKRFSKNFLLLASYTYSRSKGNYPGLVQASNTQFDPHVNSAYDLPEFMINRDGPLPSDRPHNLKLVGSYFVPLGAREDEGFTLGLKFTAISGRPIDVIGNLPLGIARESFILPRGQGGRLPMITQTDLRIGWTRYIGSYKAELMFEVFNLFNQQQVTDVDMIYTFDEVQPIPNGRPEDLATLRTASDNVATPNPNFGQPTARQAPLSLRFGAKLSF